MTTPDIVFKQESFEIMGACFAVYKTMGCGFLEAVYQECLELELTRRGIPFSAYQRLSLSYDGTPLSQFYQADIICHGKIILELKAAEDLTNQHRTQLLNYLKATGISLGILLNFGHYPLLQYERLTAQARWQTRNLEPT